MRGGKPLRWVQPLDPTGNMPGSIGCYRGHMEHLNLEHLRAGLIPRYVNRKNVTRRRAMGWRIATPEEARMSGESYDQQARLDSSQGHGGLVLMVAPLEVVARSQAMKAAQTRSGLAAETERFLTTSRPGEDDHGRPIRFRTADHGVYVEAR